MRLSKSIPFFALACQISFGAKSDVNRFDYAHYLYQKIGTGLLSNEEDVPFAYLEACSEGAKSEASLVRRARTLTLKDLIIIKRCIQQARRPEDLMTRRWTLEMITGMGAVSAINRFILATEEQYWKYMVALGSTGMIASSWYDYLQANPGNHSLKGYATYLYNEVLCHRNIRKHKLFYGSVLMILLGLCIKIAEATIEPLLIHEPAAVYERSHRRAPSMAGNEPSITLSKSLRLLRKTLKKVQQCAPQPLAS